MLAPGKLWRMNAGSGCHSKTFSKAAISKASWVSTHKQLQRRSSGAVETSLQLQEQILVSERQPRNIIVAVDDDQLSWQAVRFTVAELYREGDVLHLLHVIPRDSYQIPVPPAALGSMSYCESMDFESFLWEHATEFIKDTMVGLADERKAQCEVDIVRGVCRESIGQAICKAADQLEAKLIVVPGRQRPGLLEQIFNGDSAAFGSYVAKHSSRPTVIFQPPQ